MMSRLMRGIGEIVVRHPVWVLLFSAALTALLYSHIRYLRMGTDLTDMFGRDNPEWRSVSAMGKELGYGNQLFVMVEAPDNRDASESMEEFGDRLVESMQASGLFRYARCGLSEDELLRMVKLYVWNFPSFVQPEQREEIQSRLRAERIGETFRRVGTAMVTPFSTMGANYFLTDPLGLMEPLANGGKGFSQFSSFDLSGGSGNHFFSKDHKALLIVSQPKQSAVDYQFAEKVVGWTNQAVRDLMAGERFRNAGLRITPAGAYVYAEQDRTFIEQNIRVISILSVVGNVLLCLLVYPRVGLFLLSLVPTSLGILWTTGIASYYPGEVNLISMSFIAILAGLGDDQIVHFINRVPQEWRLGGTLRAAFLGTYEKTGPSIVFCILTVGTATAALWTSSLKVLAEFGFILTAGMFMMLFHTIFTVPAIMHLWWRFSKPPAPETITFRFLPSLAGRSLTFTERHAGVVRAAAVGVFCLSATALPFVRMNRKIEITRGEENPALLGQRRLSDNFGIEGSPEVLLITGSQEEVLRRAEQLTARLEEWQRRGTVRSIFTPTGILSSGETQARRAATLVEVDFNAAVAAVRGAIRSNGFREEPFVPFLESLERLRGKRVPVTVESASEYFPAGLLDNSIRKIGDGTYLAAVAYYGTDPDATEVIPQRLLDEWRREAGPFVDFSFNKINREVQSHILGDSRRALFLTAFGITLLVYLCFRNLRDSLVALSTIVFAIVVTFGLLRLLGHSFSSMSITAIPLIIGIGIDNGIHLMRRYREDGGNQIFDVARASGAAVIQSNLTTIVGFGALMASSFGPLAEIGLVTTVGVVLALAAALMIVPAFLSVERDKRLQKSAAHGE
jgi:predicted RND superfamily exporter protein